MEIKLCRKCNIEKDIENFRLKKDKCGKYYRYSYCKDCEKKYNNLTIEMKKIRDKRYRQKHKKEINLKAKIKRHQMTLQEKEKRKQYMQQYIPLWREKNKEKVKKYYITDNEKRNKNEFLHFKDQIRNEVLRSFKSKGQTKNKHTEEIVGINLKKLYVYLKYTFKINYGYEWDGIEKVHIDHIIPLSVAKNEKDIIKLCHYTNLQLLKAKDNLKKYNKLNWELK